MFNLSRYRAATQRLQAWLAQAEDPADLAELPERHAARQAANLITATETRVTGAPLMPPETRVTDWETLAAFVALHNRLNAEYQRARQHTSDLLRELRRPLDLLRERAHEDAIRTAWTLGHEEPGADLAFPAGRILLLTRRSRLRLTDRALFFRTLPPEVLHDLTRVQTQHLQQAYNPVTNTFTLGGQVYTPEQLGVTFTAEERDILITDDTLRAE